MGWDRLVGTGVATALKIVQWPTPFLTRQDQLTKLTDIVKQGRMNLQDRYMLAGCCSLRLRLPTYDNGCAAREQHQIQARNMPAALSVYDWLHSTCMVSPIFRQISDCIAGDVANKTEISRMMR